MVRLFGVRQCAEADPTKVTRTARFAADFRPVCWLHNLSVRVAKTAGAKVETDKMKRQTMPVTAPSKEMLNKETPKLDRQYGKIGISAVAAAMRYQRDSDEYATPAPAPRPGAWKKGAAA